MKRLDSLLLILILVLTGYYYYQNVDKIIYTRDVILQGVEQSKSESGIVRVEIFENGVVRERKSFVKEVVKNSEERNMLFMEIPEDIPVQALIDGRMVVEVNGRSVIGALQSDNVVLFEDVDMALYIINGDYKNTVAKLIE